jgi:hypothetical protein
VVSLCVFVRRFGAPQNDLGVNLRVALALTLLDELASCVAGLAGSGLSVWLPSAIFWRAAFAVALGIHPCRLHRPVMLVAASCAS